MTVAFANPAEMAQALQERDESAREQLRQWLREPLARLLRELAQRHHLPHDPETLLLHALHSAETFVRTRPPRDLARLGWPAFRATLLFQVARVMAHPFGQVERDVAPLALPDCPTYESRAYFQPYERLGDAWFGGDWYAGREANDGALWIIVADITGHGYHAYLLATALPGVWDLCWKKAGADWQPADLLAAMHELLESCLPDGIYVECTLARLASDGAVTIAPAGGSRLFLKRQDSAPNLVKLRGTWLGLLPPSRKDQHTWALGEGDELLLGSDGLFDQLGGSAGADAQALATAATGSRSLFEHLQRLVRQALQREPQQDDITMVLLRRRPVLREATPSPASGTGNVPV